MPRRAVHIEQRIRACFAEMTREFEMIGDVRGRGVLLGIELVTDREHKTPANEEAREIARLCQQNGLIFQLRGVGDLLNVIRLVPPMTTSDEEIDRALSIMRDAIATVSSRGRRAAAN